nr:uncharacterized protein LOC119168676 [Rhipicephalus microplus]
MPSRSSKSSLSTKSFTSASSHFKDSAENDKHWKSSLYEELASKGTELSTAETPRTRRQHEIATAIATIGLLVVIGALLAAYFYTTGMKRKKVVTCVTEDCVAFGQELSAAINKAADPCHDFHAYVCGTWDDPNRQVSTEDQMRTAALNMAIREVREDKSHVGRAAQFFESCNRAATDTTENLRLFTELRASLGLTWPEHSTPDVKHPLDIMVDLALNWQMNFLFDITTTFVRGSPTLLVLRGRLDAVWEQDLRNPRTPEHIVEAKIDFLYDTPQQDWLRVGDLDDKTPTFSTGSWLNALAKHDKQFNWTRDSPVIVEDIKILETTARLLKNLTRENLVVALSWIFIQTHLWAVVGTPSLRFRGSSSEVQTMKEHGCMTYVESLLGLSIVAKLMSDRYGYLESRHHAVSFWAG